MSSDGVSSVYTHVIDDVIDKMREEFEKFGTSESVLNDLQAIWEMKLIDCGAISGTIDRPNIGRQAGMNAPVHDLNVPYDDRLEEYQTPTAEMLFPPTPLVHIPAQTPLPGLMDQGMYNIPGPYDPSRLNERWNGVDPNSGKPDPYMQPFSPLMNQRLLSVDVNVAYDEGRNETDRADSHKPLTQDFFTMSSGKRKRSDYAMAHLSSGGYMPQQDGNADLVTELSHPKTGQAQNKSSVGSSQESVLFAQKDGTHDDYYDDFPYQGDAAEGSNTPMNGMVKAKSLVCTPRPIKSDDVEDDEPPLNEDDDEDDLEDIEQGEDEQCTHHLILAQFDKVTRTKNRWKCSLKDGIMHLNGRDLLFNKATGEFDF